MFSVIIPIYNKAPHLDRTITSVLNQKFEEWELILVDDGSTDGSYEKAKSYSDSRIQLFTRNEPGPGGYAARNLGIKKAKYEWVAFLDADDEWMDNHLSTFLELIEIQPETNIVSTSWTDNFEENKEGRFFPNTYNLKHKTKGIHEITLPVFLQNSINGAPPFWTGAVGFRADLLREIEGFPEGRCKRGGDVDTWLRAIYYGEPAIWSPKLTVVYHRDSVNMVTKLQGFELGCEFTTVKKLAEMSNDKEVIKLLFQFLNARVVSRWLQTLRVGQNPESLWGKVKWKYLTKKGAIITFFSILPSSMARQLYRLTNKGKYD
ncbi:glycosyltransferase family 2 protein [Cyclobacterium qasimii]|uniref:Glycosyl transferase n=2 Tax=Cyclobacterium qasimii TaxID=1350429 RepID=S7VBW3_9BACT|nr:glycosyltransferase family A protein [Cyclobacterium qasimii]EPR67471.1 glycosyl transferase [Cyclobacterium qasimii M12-11B]GEO21782.1 glycosyl transferase [Cyclobacterium qasimii]